MLDTVLNHLTVAVVFILIPGIANSMPVFAHRFKINFLNYPIDCGAKLNNKRVLGDGKTWRGFFFAWLGSGILLSLLLYFVIPDVLYKIPLISDLSLWQFLLFSSGLSISALIGDSLKSFFKRQSGIKRGHSWFPFDQLDWIIGAALFYIIIFGWQDFIYFTFILGLISHLLVKLGGYLLGIETKAF